VFQMIYKKTMWQPCSNENYLLVGRDLISDSFSRPILSFKPNFKSGIPERKHFIRIFPVTSQRRTTPKIITISIQSSKHQCFGDKENS